MSEEVADKQCQQLQLQMQHQKSEQEKLARQVVEETEAKGTMESQLSNMQTLLGKLLNNRTSQAEISVATTIPTVTTPVAIPITPTIATQPSVSDLTLGKCSVDQQLFGVSANYF